MAGQLRNRGTTTKLFPYRAGFIAMPLLFAACPAFGSAPEPAVFPRAGTLPRSSVVRALPRSFFCASASANAFATSAFVGACQGVSEVPAVVATTLVPSSVPQKSSCLFASSMSDLRFNEREDRTGGTRDVGNHTHNRGKLSRACG